MIIILEFSKIYNDHYFLKFIINVVTLIPAVSAGEPGATESILAKGVSFDGV